MLSYTCCNLFIWFRQNKNQIQIKEGDNRSVTITESGLRSSSLKFVAVCSTKALSDHRHCPFPGSSLGVRDGGHAGLPGFHPPHTSPATTFLAGGSCSFSSPSTDRPPLPSYEALNPKQTTSVLNCASVCGGDWVQTRRTTPLFILHLKQVI